MTIRGDPTEVQKQPVEPKRKSRALQDEVTRRRRLNRGCCPSHGCALAAMDYNPETEEYLVECPRGGCTFKDWVLKGSATERAL